MTVFSCPDNFISEIFQNQEYTNHLNGPKSLLNYTYTENSDILFERGTLPILTVFSRSVSRYQFIYTLVDSFIIAKLFKLAELYSIGHLHPSPPPPSVVNPPSFSFTYFLPLPLQHPPSLPPSLT